MTPQSDLKISMKHGINIIDSIYHLTRAEDSRNTPIIDFAKKLQAFLEFAQDLDLASG